MGKDWLKSMSQMKKGKQTFIVEIIEHQKSTWQGQVHWIQENKKVSFRSVMELLYLINSAITFESDSDQKETDMTEEK